MTTVIKEIIQAMLKDLTNEQLIKLKEVLKEKQIGRASCRERV